MVLLPLYGNTVCMFYFKAFQFFYVCMFMGLVSQIVNGMVASSSSVRGSRMLQLSSIGPMAYPLALPPNLKVHNVFHISILKIYDHDATRVINWNDVQVEPKGYFLVEPDCILKKREILLQNRTIGKVKV